MKKQNMDSAEKKFRVSDYYVEIGVFVLVVMLFFLFFTPGRKLFRNEPVVVVSSGTFSANDSLMNVLVESRLSGQDIGSIKAALSRQMNINRIYREDVYEIHKTTSNGFIKFYYRPMDPGKYFEVFKTTNNVFVCNKVIVTFEKEVRRSSGSIETSLWDAMVSDGIAPDIILKFADVFSWQVDFLTDVRKGDRYIFAYERFKNKGRVVKTGRILVAQYQGEAAGEHTGIYFEAVPENGDYYDQAGNSLRKMFLKAPLSYRRISSYFSYHRFHPILKYYRPHLAIDYSAPSGTPIDSIGDGIVTYAAWKGQGGKTVMIRHNSIYTSIYGHLSGYGKGVRVGKRVRQGQVIGYVGSTGLATGPHLDFRIWQYGKPVNYLRLKFPSNKNIEAKDKPAFDKLKSEVLLLLK